MVAVPAGVDTSCASVDGGAAEGSDGDPSIAVGVIPISCVSGEANGALAVTVAVCSVGCRETVVGAGDRVPRGIAEVAVAPVVGEPAVGEGVSVGVAGTGVGVSVGGAGACVGLPGVGGGGVFVGTTGSAVGVRDGYVCRAGEWPGAAHAAS
ncbi:MAG: hypothetical protein KAS81_02770 [Anaerolineales bacterium]|nr:hypothetical protein [Anaerolineales bacterium]